MTNEQLAALALAAIDDLDARVVLDDARIEGCLDELECRHVWLTEDEWPRAIAAEILFADWPTRWELAEKCVMRVPIPNMSLEMLSGPWLESLAMDMFDLMRVTGERDDELRARCMSSPVYSPLAIYGPSLRSQR